MTRTCARFTRFRRASVGATALASVVLFATGCANAPVKVFTHPEADLSYYQKVGVVPFRSLAADRLAGEKFTTEFSTAVLAAQLFEVMDYGVFVAHVTRILGTKSPVEGISAEELKQIAAATGVQGVFEGTVSEYQMTSTPSGSFPVVSVEVRLVDVQTATVVWSATTTERGGPKTPIIGIGEIHTLGELSQRISQRLVSELK